MAPFATAIEQAALQIAAQLCCKSSGFEFFIFKICCMELFHPINQYIISTRIQEIPEQQQPICFLAFQDITKEIQLLTYFFSSFEPNVILYNGVNKDIIKLKPKIMPLVDPEDL